MRAALVSRSPDASEKLSATFFETPSANSTPAVVPMPAMAPPAVIGRIAVAALTPQLLPMLRGLRDSRLAHTAAGRELIALYYEHSEETVDILDRDRALLARATKVVSRLRRAGLEDELTGAATGTDAGARLLALVAELTAAGVDPDTALRATLRGLGERVGPRNDPT